MKKESNKSVFISRDLEADSPFKDLLTQRGFQVSGQSLIEFRAVSFDEIPEVEWIFFYSRRGVRFFLETLAQRALSLPTDVCLAAMGAGTAQELDNAGLYVHFTGTGHPESTAVALLKKVQGQRVLFPRARRSRRSVERLLGNSITAVNLIVYDNQPTQNVPRHYYDILVFTSPMNVRAFFQQHAPKKTQRIIAIGPSTADALTTLTITTVELAPNPTEEALATQVLGSS